MNKRALENFPHLSEWRYSSKPSILNLPRQNAVYWFLCCKTHIIKNVYIFKMYTFLIIWLFQENFTNFKISQIFVKNLIIWYFDQKNSKTQYFFGKNSNITMTGFLLVTSWIWGKYCIIATMLCECTLTETASEHLPADRFFTSKCPRRLHSCWEGLQSSRPHSSVRKRTANNF